MQMDAQNSAAKRQQQAMDAALRQQDEYSRQAEQTAMKNADEYRPEARMERFEEARQEAGDSLAGQLVKAREQAPVNVAGGGGRLSQTFDAARATAQADQFQRSVDLARMMGKMRGANDMVTKEGFINADYASQLRQIGRNAQGTYQAAQPGIAAAGQVNSGKMIGGGLISGVGMAGLSSSLGKGMADMFKTKGP
jgi:hypothetical protein